MTSPFACVHLLFSEAVGLWQIARDDASSQLNLLASQSTVHDLHLNIPASRVTFAWRSVPVMLTTAEEAVSS